MRQAGRVLPDYRRLRAASPTLAALFDTPELAARVTMMPVAQLGVDAAILFTDLVTPLKALGVEYAYAPGPVLAHPPQAERDLERLRRLPVEEALGHVLETVRLVRAQLDPSVALIGYVGAPFTLAAWLTEGQAPRECARLRCLLHASPARAAALLERLAQLAGDFACAQVEAGAQAIQLFDTSVGVLSAEQYERFALPAVQQVFARLAPLAVPRIYFALDAAHLLPWLPATGASVLGLDWRTPLATAYRSFGARFPLQGNLDPAVLFAPPAALEAAVADILRVAHGRPHVFNLGHGLLPETPLAAVHRLIERVHAGDCWQEEQSTSVSE